MDRHADLNPAQRSAVLATEGPVLVLAGAGAGKTRVIVERIKEIIRNGTEPEAVLAITFTNKAAGEMRQRIGPGPFVSTFHSLGLYLLKEHHKLLGYKRTPAIYDRADSLSTIKKALKEGFAEEFEPRMVLGTISRQKGDGVRVDAYDGGSNPYDRAVAAAWRKYENALREDGAVDFDDLLLHAVELLEKFPHVREQCLKRWQYIHIDEYQDTNRIQADLTHLLVGPAHNICAVGDVDQTIYSWRGAQIANILSFERRYPNAQVITLEHNYRSTKNILDAANHLIAHNTNRPEKNLLTHKPAGERISVYTAGDGGDEALFVAHKIQDLIRNGAQPNDIAVLYRANFQSRLLEEKLLDTGIPYQVLGTRFYERKEIKDVLSYVRAALYRTPADIGRASETPRRGIGKVSVMKLLRNEPAGPKVEVFKRLLERIESKKELPPPELLKFVIVESGMEAMYKEDKFEGQERLGNLKELVTLSARYSDVEDFLGAVSLASEQDEIKEERNQVRLMTIHASKGLEFPYVFIVGLEEGLFPMSREAGEDPEEERRLMYVAITRAEKKLYLSHAMMRIMYGSVEVRHHSSFLQELPEEVLEAESPERISKTIYLD